MVSIKLSIIDTHKGQVPSTIEEACAVLHISYSTLRRMAINSDHASLPRKTKDGFQTEYGTIISTNFASVPAGWHFWIAFSRKDKGWKK